MKLPTRYFRFSILNLLLIATIVAMGLVIWQQTKQVARLRLYLQKAEQGESYLDIADRTNCYVKHIESVYHPLRNRWRVWLPRGREYQICYLANNVPAAGVPADRSYVRVGEKLKVGQSSGIPWGEYTIDCTLGVSRAANEARAITRIEGVSSEFGHISTLSTVEFHFQDQSVEEGEPMLTMTEGVEREQRRVPSNQPVVLLRSRHGRGSVIADNGSPVYGLLIWIEPIPDAK
jgi:hypothetical protein